MTTIDDYLNFPVPRKHIRESYRAESVASEGSSHSHVKVMKNMSPDGRANLHDKKWEQIAEYDRNYSLLKTFEPFQQLRNGIWKDYALISTRYTRLEVMDLGNGEIIAIEPYPKADEETARMSNGRVKEGDSLPSKGFCPMEFYVPDWWDRYDASYLPAKDPATGATTSPWTEDRYAIEVFNGFANFTGQWALYGGCLWGDDTSAKLRYINLSRISEGVVTTDARFGYVALPNEIHIKDAVDIYEDDELYIEVKTPIFFDLGTGKALGKNVFFDHINWKDQ